MPRTILRPTTPPLDQAFTINRDSMQAAGLLNWWPLMDRGGGLGRDLAGFLDATFDTSMVWQADPVRGVAPYMPAATAAATSAGPAFGSSGTIAFWAYADFDPTAASVFRYAFDCTAGHRWILYCPGSNQWGLYINSTSLVDPGLTGLIPQAAWTQIVLTWSATAQTIYQNGASFGTFSASVSGATPATFYIAQRFSTDQHWVGMLSDVRIYNRALSAQEVWQLWAPQTRWELYRPAKWRTIVQAGAAAPASSASRLLLLGVG